MIISGQKAGNRLILRSKGGFYGILITVDGDNDAIVNVYDWGLSAAPDASAKMLIPRNFRVRGINYYGGIFAGGRGEVTNGIYVTITGTGARYVVYYDND